MRDIQENGRISRRNDLFQGIAAHPGACGKPGWLTNRTFGSGLLSRRFQRRRCDRQGYQAFCRHGGWGYFNFNHHEPKVPTAAVQPKSNCAFCHIAGAKRDEVWTQFYRMLDEAPLPQGVGVKPPGQ